MKTIPKEVYEDLAVQLKHKMSGSDFFNGTLIYEDGIYNCYLKCTVIPGYVPVWYEFGGEGDFTWNEFLEYL